MTIVRGKSKRQMPRDMEEDSLDEMVPKVTKKGNRIWRHDNERAYGKVETLQKQEQGYTTSSKTRRTLAEKNKTRVKRLERKFKISEKEKALLVYKVEELENIIEGLIPKPRKRIRRRRSGAA